MTRQEPFLPIYDLSNAQPDSPPPTLHANPYMDLKELLDLLAIAQLDTDCDFILANGSTPL